jgi:hypothetical protein
MRITLGFGAQIVFLFVIIMSLIKGIYNTTGDNQIIPLANVIKRLVSALYYNVPLVPSLWQFSPNVDLQNPLTTFNINFLIIFILFVISTAVRGSGIQLYSRVRKVEIDIEDEIMKASLRSGPKLSREEMKQNVEIAPPSLLSSLHDKYGIPVITGLVIAFFTFLFGWN